MGATHHTAEAISIEVAAKIPDATRRVLGDAGGFSRWLLNHCMRIRSSEPSALLDPETTAAQLKFLCVPSLVSLVNDMRQAKGVTIAARDALTLRYLADDIVKARIVATARQMHADEALQRVQAQDDVDAQLRRTNAATASLLAQPL